MEMLMQGLPLIVLLIGLIVSVQAIVRRVRFDSEDVLRVRRPDGRVVLLRLSSLRSAPAAQREIEIQKATAKLA